MSLFTLNLRLHNRKGGGEFRANESWLTGARALDFCRAHGLPDSTRVPFADSYCGACDRTIELPEAIARELFGASTVEETVVISPEDCLPGEIVPADYYGGVKCDKPQAATIALAEVSLERALVLRQISQLRRRAETAEAALSAAEKATERLERQIEELTEELAEAIGEA